MSDIKIENGPTTKYAVCCGDKNNKMIANGCVREFVKRYHMIMQSDLMALFMKYYEDEMVNGIEYLAAMNFTRLHHILLCVE